MICPTDTELAALVVAGVADAVVVTDVPGRVVLFNAAAERLYGMPFAEVAGRYVVDALTVEGGPGDDEGWPPDAAAVDAGPVSLLARHRRSDGTTFDAEVGLSAVRHPDGTVLGVAGVIRDVTDRLAERARTEALRAMVDAAVEAIVGVDERDVVRFFSPAAERLYGYRGEDVVGASIWRLAADHPRLQARDLRARVRAGRAVHVETIVRRRDGGRVAVQLTISPVVGPDGGYRGAVITGLDISERRRAEREASHARHLRERAGQLERSNADLEEFAYAASHNLQEPLRSIKMGAETVMHAAAGRLDGEERALLAHVDAAATRMSAQVDALMDLAHVALGHETAAPVPLRLSLDDALDGLRAAILEAGVEVVVDEPLPSAAMPRAEMTLVLQNLLANAITYRRTDVPPRVTVSAAVIGEDVELRVADNGIGLTEADRARIFAIFGRAHPDLPGTGMGLALCRRILERRAGSITVASDGPGRGSTFTLRIPADYRDRPA